MVNGQKMAKSLGNFVLTEDILSQWDPLVVRYALIGSHYRSEVNLSDKSFEEAAAAVERIRSFLERSGALGEDSPEDFPGEIGAALDNDFSTPAALALLHGLITEGNRMLAEGSLAPAKLLGRNLGAALRVLGIHPQEGPWASAQDRSASVLKDLVESLIADRQRSREARDFDAADRIRMQLTEAGVSLEDTPQGTSWRIEG